MKYLSFNPIVDAPNNASISSSAIDGSQLVKLSVQAVATGTPTGSLQVQFSNDQVPVGYTFQNFTPTNWNDLGFPVAITSATTYGIAQQDICYRALRLVYTSSDVLATGTLNVHIMALSI